jgi:hypothetical protein
VHLPGRRQGYPRRAMGASRDDADAGHLTCPFCCAYEVERMYLGSLRLDSCECAACGARWDQDPRSGAYLGRLSRSRT